MGEDNKSIVLESNKNASKTLIEGRVQLPFKKAVEMSYANLKIRFWRSIITSAGVMLGIAFLVSVLSSSSILNALKGGEDVVGEAQQIWIVGMSLLVCTVGITNSLLMSVTERFREIGTMKCLGALDRHIVELFLLEATFQGFIGALIGALVGLLSTMLMFMFKYGFGVVLSRLPVLELFKSVLFAVITGTVLSIAAGVYPAYHAAKMQPAEAMRTEV